MKWPKNVGVIFDGTCLGEALAIVVRFVDDWELIRLQLLTKTMTGEEIAREIVHTVSTEYGVSGDRLVATMRDRGSANGVAMRTIKVLFPNILDVGCYILTYLRPHRRPLQHSPSRRVHPFMDKLILSLRPRQLSMNIVYYP